MVGLQQRCRINVVKTDEAVLRAFARQSLASYKVPRKVLFFTEEELPMTGSNKIQRAQLRKIATELLQQD